VSNCYCCLRSLPSYPWLGPLHRCVDVSPAGYSPPKTCPSGSCFARCTLNKMRNGSLSLANASPHASACRCLV
jgi:hypothetical protein